MNCVNAKKKGHEYERTICRRLSMWVSNLTRDDLFWRSPTSGAMATTQRNSEGKAAPCMNGDVVAVDPMGAAFTRLFFVECKCVQWFAFDVWAIRGSCANKKLWDKAIEQAEAVNRKLLFVVKENQRPDVVVVQRDGRDLLKAGEVYPAKPLRPVMTLPRAGAYMYLLTDIFDCVAFDYLRPYAKLSKPVPSL